MANDNENGTGKNYFTNPFEGLSTTEALEKARKIYNQEDIVLDELKVRRLQLQNTQPRAFSLAKKENLIAKWKGLEKTLQVQE